jgi:dipeptidyl aminopeptidase/acylaminoacyl peptidase
MTYGRAGLATAIGAALAAAATSAAWLWTPEAIVDLVAVTDARISPDGGRIAFTRTLGGGDRHLPSELLVVPFAGGATRRVVNVADGETRLRWSPDGQSLAYLSPKGETWLRQVEVRSPAGEPLGVTPQDLDVETFEWSPDGASMAFLASSLGGRRPELWVMSGTDAKPTRLVVRKNAAVEAFAWAPDGKSLAAAVPVEKSDAREVWRVPILGSARLLATSKGPICQVAWSRDGRALAWREAAAAAVRPSGCDAVFTVAAAEGGTPRPLPAAAGEVVEQLAWMPDGRLALTRRAGPQTRIDFVDPASGAITAALPSGLAAIEGPVSWSDDGERHALVGSTSEHPPEVLAGRPLRAPASGQGAEPPPVRRVTESNLALAALPLAPQRIIAGGVLVGPSEGSPRPTPLAVVVEDDRLLDGWTTTWDAPAQALAERGWTVLRVGPVRGPEEVIAAIDSVAATGPIDPARIAILGRGRAGTTAALALARFPGRFRAGVVISPLPLPDVRTSAPTVAPKVDRGPETLIVHGAEDRPASGFALTVRETVQRSGGRAEVLALPGEGRTLRGRAARLEAARRTLAWLEDHAGASNVKGPAPSRR